MIAAYDNSCGGTADVEFEAFVCWLADARDTCERTAWIRANRVSQFRRLGAVVGDSVKWWPGGPPRILAAQRTNFPALGIWSGFRSWSRGRSWDRRSRRGIK